LRVITLNVNGLRSASKKGFMPWMRRQRLTPGGQVIVATGGAMGPYLEHSCGTSAALLTEAVNRMATAANHRPPPGPLHLQAQWTTVP